LIGIIVVSEIVDQWWHTKGTGNITDQWK